MMYPPVSLLFGASTFVSLLYKDHGPDLCFNLEPKPSIEIDVILK